MIELTAYQKDVYAAKICPYCKGKTKLVDSSFIYGSNAYTDRKIICCGNYPYCNAYVGTHAKDDTALGRLANKELRLARKKAHKHFDSIWKDRYVSRKDLYDDLSDFLGIPLEYTHIGWFGVKTCYKVAKWAENYYKEFVNEAS